MKRILVIDDSRSVLQMAAHTLGENAYDVVTISDTADVRQLLSSERFDLIVTDIYMPGDDGLEIIRTRNHVCPRVPVVAMSGRKGVHDMLPIARLMGAMQTLQKPFSPADLIKAVSAAIGK